jgi:hypothetical protein
MGGRGEERKYIQEYKSDILELFLHTMAQTVTIPLVFSTSQEGRSLKISQNAVKSF